MYDGAPLGKGYKDYELDFDYKHWGDFLTNFGNLESMVKGENTGSTIYSNARALAKLAAIMADNGKGLMSGSTWDQMHAFPKVEVEPSFGGRTVYT